MDPNKIDLSEVNKTKKQFKVPNPFRKKSAGPGRDEVGRFASGGGGLKSFKKFNWKRAAPLILVISVAGGYLVYRSFAGTYKDCRAFQQEPGVIEVSVMYNNYCVSNSDEASVIRVFYGVLGRAPDSAGLEYWTNRLNGTIKPKLTVAGVAKGFMNTREFKSKYGNLSNQKFVEAMYPQVFGRIPDAAGLKYWTDRLNEGQTRESMMANFVQSEEMKKAYSLIVGDILNIEPFEQTDLLKKYSKSDLLCYAGEVVKAGSSWCRVDAGKIFDLGYIKTGDQALLAIPVESFTSKLTGGKTYNLCFKNEYKNMSSNSSVAVNALNGSPAANGQSLSEISVNTIPFTLGEKPAGTDSFSRCVYDIQVDKDTKYLLISQKSNEQSSGAEFAIDLNSVELRSTAAEPTVTARNQSAGIIKENDLQFSPKILRGAELRLYKRQPVQLIKPTDNSPHWVHKTNLLNGKQSLLFQSSVDNYQDRSKTNQVRITVKDAKTGLAVPFSLYQYRTSDRKANIQPGTAQPFTIQQDPSLGWGRFWVETSLNKPTKLTIEISYVSGPQVRNQYSQIVDYWPSENEIYPSPF